MEKSNDKGASVVAMETQKSERKNGNNKTKVDVKTDEKTPVKKLTPEELQKQLQDSILKFQSINNVINDRQNFLTKKEILQGYLQEVSQEEEQGIFKSNTCKVILQNSNSYNSNEGAISITNTSLVVEFLKFLMSKIDIKVSELEAKISF